METPEELLLTVSKLASLTGDATIISWLADRIANEVRATEVDSPNLFIEIYSVLSFEDILLWDLYSLPQNGSWSEARYLCRFPSRFLLDEKWDHENFLSELRKEFVLYKQLEEDRSPLQSLVEN